MVELLSSALHVRSPVDAVGVEQESGRYASDDTPWNQMRYWRTDGQSLRVNTKWKLSSIVLRPSVSPSLSLRIHQSSIVCFETYSLRTSPLEFVRERLLMEQAEVAVKKDAACNKWTDFIWCSTGAPTILSTDRAAIKFQFIYKSANDGINKQSYMATTKA